MGKVIEFPTSPMQRWGDWEPVFRERLEKAGATRESVQENCSSMKKHFDVMAPFAVYKGQGRLPGDLTREQAESITAALHGFADAVQKRFRDLVNEAFF